MCYNEKNDVLPEPEGEEVMPTLEEARAIFRNDLFAAEQAGIEIVAVDDHYAKCAMKVTPQHKNAAGAVMGGALFTLADYTFAIASNLGQSLTVTTTSTINFVGTCRGEMLYAKSRLIKDGRRSCFFEITITDDLDNLVAVVTANGMHLDKKL